MQKLEHNTARYIVSLFGGLIATLALFFLMIMLIDTSFVPPTKSEVRLHSVITPKVKKVEEDIKLKRVPKLEKTLEKPSAPPTSSPPPPQKPQYTTIARRVNPFIDPVKPSLELNEKSPIYINISAPNMSSNPIGPSNKYGAGLSSGAGSSSGSSAANGLNQCTIEFTLGENDQVKELFWSECIGAGIANKAENALYRWVKNKPASFVSLQARPGDRLEFTFEQR